MVRLALGVVLVLAVLVGARADVSPPITFEPIATGKMPVPADEVLQTLSMTDDSGYVARTQLDGRVQIQMGDRLALGCVDD